MSDATTPGAPAGWYRSERPGQLRYWDGTRWTEHYAPDPAASPAPATHAGPSAPPAASADAPGAAAPGAAAAAPAPSRRSLPGIAIAGIVVGAVLLLAGATAGIGFAAGWFGPSSSVSEARESPETAEPPASPEPSESPGTAPGTGDTSCDPDSQEATSLTMSLVMGVSSSRYTAHPMSVTPAIEERQGRCLLTMTAVLDSGSQFTGDDLSGLLSLVDEHADEVPDSVEYLQFNLLDSDFSTPLSLADAFTELGGDATGITAESGVMFPMSAIKGTE
ncbi:DUF2510 domain-containing protein [Leucobacter massiliensis]|uniref:DUF2510 domain-containing protein n=1 Tax=Leucobacter massiliensis TaxID=1686285 RepID=UPI000D0048A2|nr:DUF2510 domain-containing protein [Leucobacter massiliensis]